jgi:branched-chain amino acid transport system permease protein
MSLRNIAKRVGLADISFEGRSFWVAWALLAIVPPILAEGLSAAGILNSYYYDVLMRMGISVILAVSLNIVNGHLGQFSIGHAGFMGIGAYVSGMLIAGGNPGYAGVELRQPGFLSTLPSLNLLGYQFSSAFLLATLIGGVAAAMTAFVIGFPAFRTRGDYLAVVTLAFNMIIVNIFVNMQYVGGARGLTGLPNYSNFIWVWLFVMATVIVSRNLVTSAHGRAIMSVRENEVAAELGGVNTRKYKLIALAVGAFFAGVGGALLGFHVMFINPSMFNVFRSIDYLIMIYLGGVGSITGTALGAILWTLLQEVLRFMGVWRLVLGPILLIIVMLFWQKGLTKSELPFIIKRQKGGPAVVRNSEHK